MTIAYIDTLAISKRLQALGLSAEVAEGLPEILIDLVNNVAASKGDAAKIRDEIAEVKHDLKKEMGDLRKDMEIQKRDIVIQIWTIGTIIVGVIAAFNLWG